jgi:hypothetical protein
MDGYMVGDSAEPRRTALEEAMAEIEEDMISKVKKDLTQYLDRLEKKVSVNRDLKDKAKDAVKRGRAEEEIEEFAPVGGDDREPDEEEILRQLAAQWWNGTEQQMAKAQNTLAAMGWEIGQDESGDDDAGVFVIRAGDENGNSYMAFPHSELDLLDELDYSAASGATAQPSANQQAQTAGNAIKKYMPAATKFAANTVRQMKGQDPTKDPSYAKLSPAQQQQYVQAQKTIDATDADELEKFDANQAAANVQGMAKTVVNPANMPDVNLKSNVVDRKTASDYAPATVNGKPAAPYANEEQGNDFNTYTTNAQGQRLQQSPNLMGVQQTKNLDTGDTTTDFNQGPMSASQTKNAAGATTAKAQSVDLGVAKFGTKQQQPNYAAGQLASPTVAKVSVPAGDATVTQKSYAGPMLGGASGPGVGNNVITKAAQVVPNANPAKSAVDPAAAADATATANQLSQAAAPALNKQPGLQERSHPVETFEMSDGSCLECYGDDEQGYELRRQGNSLPSRFKTRKHVKMAVDLFRARRKQNQDLSQDYIQEK